jgi:hypothetical protein
LKLARRHADLGHAVDRRTDARAGAKALDIDCRTSVSPLIVLGELLGKRGNRSRTGNGETTRLALAAGAERQC